MKINVNEIKKMAITIANETLLIGGAGTFVLIIAYLITKSFAIALFAVIITGSVALLFGSLYAIAYVLNLMRGYEVTLRSPVVVKPCQEEAKETYFITL